VNDISSADAEWLRGWFGQKGPRHRASTNVRLVMLGAWLEAEMVRLGHQPPPLAANFARIA
jgi:hypothetical protein